MKKLLLLFIVLLSFQAWSQQVVSSCTATADIIKRYKKDADRLALRRTFYTNSTYKDSVKIDPVLSHTYLSALLAVYNATMLTARDTVITTYDLHTNPVPEMNRVTITAASANAWMQNLESAVIPTSYTPIDALLAQYSLGQPTYYQSNPYDVVFLTTDTNYNMIAMAGKFAAVSSVISSTPAVAFNDVKNIKDSINPAFTMLSYSYGWGTCPNGCDYRATWTFKVYPDCKVESMGRTGDDPATVGIKENTALFNDVLLYPNPANEKLSLSFASAKQRSGELLVLNTLGQTLVQSHFKDSSTQEINMSALGAGIYYVTLKSADGAKVFKVVKE